MREAARLEPVERVRARLSVPGDKSISHRALLFSAIAGGCARVRGLAPGRDVASTAAAVAALGAGLERIGPAEVEVTGPAAWTAGDPIDCGNAGTLARLLLGALAPRARGRVVVAGDDSLSRRPMARVTRPLEAMGAEIVPAAAGAAGRLPLVVEGRRLTGREHRLGVASAQVKSAILLAGLAADGETTVVEPGASRDHTERMLAAMGAPIARGEAGSAEGEPEPARRVTVRAAELSAIDAEIPGDFSSAAFLLALAAARPDSEVVVEDVGVNPTRTGFLEILRAMGADVEVDLASGDPEPSGTIRVAARPLEGVDVDPALVPRAIDELPLVAVVATAAEGETRVSGAGELKVKESDRIAAIAAGLSAMGASIEAKPDGFVVEGPVRLSGGSLDAARDHRIGMALAIAAALAEGPSTLAGAGWIDVSWPGFLRVLERCARGEPVESQA